MIARNSIDATLLRLDRLYRKLTNTAATMLVSKLAVLETCSWTEQAVDQILYDSLCDRIVVYADLNAVDKMIGRNSGFHYDSNVRPLLVEVLGVIGVNELENDMDPRAFENLKSCLGTMKDYRNRCAHTHVTGSIPNMASPSICVNNLNHIVTGLVELENKLTHL